MITSTQKMNHHNRRDGQPVFTYVLPSTWCEALMSAGCEDQELCEKVLEWLDEYGLRRPFMASDVFLDKPESDFEYTEFITQPCRTYFFSR